MFLYLLSYERYSVLKNKFVKENILIETNEIYSYIGELYFRLLVEIKNIKYKRIDSDYKKYILNYRYIKYIKKSEMKIQGKYKMIFEDKLGYKFSILVHTNDLYDLIGYYITEEKEKFITYEELK